MPSTDNKPFRVLSIDGGGIRGLIPALVLEYIEEKTGRPTSELFDLIAGTSTGGLIALALTVDNGHGASKFSASQVVDMYQSQGDRIFSRSVWHRIRSVGNAFDEKYPKDGLTEIANTFFGTSTLKETTTEVLIPAYETERRIPWFFKSLNAKDLNKASHNHKMVDVALATSAAPTYFEPHKVGIGNDDYFCFVDGGIYANNPALCALVEATTKFKRKTEEVVMLSLGTGQLTRRYQYDDIKKWGLLNWAQPVLSCVFDGVSDTVDYQLSKILKRDQYYRMQVELTEGNDDMDDASRTNLRMLRLHAENVIRTNRNDLKKLMSLIT